MKTDSFEIHRVLQESGRRFTVPIYQRQFAWREDRLQPFWDDLVNKAEELVDGSQPRFQHYMGALILAPGADGYSVGRTSSVQVVDGQQRLTTFQLFLAALRSVASAKGHAAVGDALDVYMINDERGSAPGAAREDRLKLVPTPADRTIFKELLTEDEETIRTRYTPDYYFWNGKVKAGVAPRALMAYQWLRQHIADYAEHGVADAEDIEPEALAEPSLVRDRLQALADALLLHFKIVVITLEEGDDAQVIFETLNSRGEPLLAMDLVRNNIFHRAQAQDEDAEKLFESRWRAFDAQFWKDDAPRAKPKRPRIDHFLSYALTAQTGRETSLRELYAEYRQFARPKGKPRFDTVGEELDALLRFNPIYEALEKREGDEGLAWLGDKLAVWEVGTVYPLVLATASSNIPLEDQRKIWALLYSYIVRRAICGLSTQNLNKNFTRIVGLFRERGASLETFRESFREQTGPAVRFPDDVEFERAILGQPVYLTVRRSERLVDILWEMERAMRSKFQADTARPPWLSIEHIMPQQWQAKWPLLDGRAISDSPDPAMMTAMRAREARLHVLGNLTFLPPPLNASMSNDAFDDKRPRIGETLLAMNTAIERLPTWDEDAIDTRGRALAMLAKVIWPTP